MKNKYKGGRGKNEREDAEYIAVLRDIEPAGAGEFSELFDVSLNEARRRLEKIYQEDNTPVMRKKINGTTVWSLNESGMDARAQIAADEIRRRLGLDEKQ